MKDQPNATPKNLYRSLEETIRNFALLIIRLVVWASIYPAANIAIAQNWIKTPSPGGFMYCLAASADGTTLITANQFGAVAISTNWGASWTNTGISAAAVACSANGKALVAAGYPSGGPIYTSTDAGATWVQQSNAPITYWQCVASSTDGTKLVAANRNGYYSSHIYTSPDAGATWTAPNWPWESWESVACSADGTKLFAAAYNGGYIYYSANSGASWNVANAPSAAWQAIAASADGTKVAAVVHGGALYTSIDSGHTFTARAGAPSTSYNSLACSADGTVLIAGDNSSVYISTNFGTAWTQSSLTDGWWYGVACSGDGKKFAAMSEYGSVYVSQPTPSLLIAQSGSNVVLSWPASVVGFKLVQNSDLSAATWTTVTNVPTTVGQQNQVSVPSSVSAAFYQLQFP